LQIGTGL